MSGPPSIDAIIEKLSAYPPGTLENNAQASKEALGLSRQLTLQLSCPVTTATDLVYSPCVAVAARIAVDLELFPRIAASKEEAVTTDQLAVASNAEPMIINRILRLLAGVGYVHQTSKDSWCATPLTDAMATPAVSAGHRFIWDMLITSAIKAPKYLRETQHRCPTEPRDGFVQYAFQTKYTAFEVLSTTPALNQDFNSFMGNTMGARRYWVDWFPVKERLLDGFDPAKALLVDVGGGRGHDLEAFRAKYPGQGRLVLQDLKQGLEGAASLDEVIERQEHDFFTPQKERGARAYLCHHILHDWSNKYCLDILKHFREAMTPGYSRLLLHELILPDIGATQHHGIFDMMMMTFNGGMERSRTQWSELIAEAGLEIEKFWVDDKDADGIVEVVRRV